VGSVKSNMGHSEVAAAICSIIKSIFAFETGKIAPNINFTEPKSNIESLQSGIMKVVTEAQELDGSLIGLNTFGIGGANCEMLENLKICYY
jgi:fatty acid synthase